jgi:uncharacterized protein (DUF1015 family)
MDNTSTSQNVVGVVVSIAPNEIQVDIGRKYAGFIPRDEYSNDPTADPMQELKVGDKLNLTIMSTNDNEGTMKLSKRIYDRKASWQNILSAKESEEVMEAVVAEVVKGTPEYDFVSDEGFGHQFWVIKDRKMIDRITESFAEIPAMYVADGHHRTAAAARVGEEKKAANPNHTGDEEYCFFLSVIFPDNQLKIIDYNRVLKDLNGLTKEEVIEKLGKNFDVKEMGTEIYQPSGLHNFSMYIDGKWYSFTAKPGTYNDNDPIGVLDVTILSNLVLDEIFGIKDLRTDKRIDFVGGIRGLGELKRRVDSGEMKIAFALYPVSMKQLIDIADTGNIMPPKTTWFEPKLRSGLVIHSLD